MASKWLKVMLILLSFGPLTGYASECEDDCVAVGEWYVNVGVGLGWRSNPLHQGEDSPMFILPEFGYYGKRFFIENLDIGWTLFEDRHHQLNLLFTPSADQMFYNRWDPYNFFDPGSSGGGTFSAPVAQSRTVNVPKQPGISTGSSSSSDGQAPPGSDPESMPAEVISLGEVNRLWVNGREVSLASDESEDVDYPTFAIDRQQDDWTLSGLQEGDRISVSTADDSASSTRQDYIYRNGSLEATTDTALDASLSKEQIPASDLSTRKMAGLAGLEYFYSSDHFELHTQALADVTGVNDGYELRLAAIFPWQMAASNWAITIGANYKSKEILDYYYGVHADDTPDSNLYFEPQQAGASTMFRLDWQKPISRHWSLRGIVQYTLLPAPILDSPVVSNSSYSMVFFGGVYHF